METLVYKLPVFEGPLDVLLFLISKNKLNIYDIAISELLDQYLGYLAKMKELDLELTSDFLEMASRLVQIKSDMLLPHRGAEENDPRNDLVRTLTEYKTCKEMAAMLEHRDIGSDIFYRKPMKTGDDEAYRGKHYVWDLYEAMLSVKGKVKRRQPPPQSAFRQIVAVKVVSVTSRIIHIVKRLLREGSKPFDSLFEDAQGRSEVVATFLAVLELIKSQRVVIGQDRKQTVKIIRGVH